MNSSLPSSDFIPPGCEVYAVVGGRLHQPSILTQAFLIIIIIVNTLTFPLTAASNALVMIAVKKKPRLREHKSKIALALLASTDFVVGVIVQPVNVAMMITLLNDDISGETCALQVFTRALSRVVVSASFFHMVLISGERYLAMKHSFAHFTLLTETRLLVASVLAWLLSIILHINFAANESVFMPINNTFYCLCLAFIIFCHVTVYREIRRHEKQIAAQQVTVEAREQFQKDKKAFKVTFIIIIVLILCYLPIPILSAVLDRFRSKISLEVLYICFFLTTLMAFLNSFFNPIIYSFRLREFRVAFIELICKTANTAEAEQREMKIFGTPNAVVRIEAGQENEGQVRQNVEQ